jgi:hypothetical protein
MRTLYWIKHSTSRGIGEAQPLPPTLLRQLHFPPSFETHCHAVSCCLKIARLCASNHFLNDAGRCPTFQRPRWKERESDIYHIVILEREHAGSLEPGETFHLLSLDRLAMRGDTEGEENATSSDMDDGES